MTIAREEISVRYCDPGYETTKRQSGSPMTPLRPGRLCQAADLDNAPEVAEDSRREGLYQPRASTCIPFGGYKQSGNGREWGEYGFTEFLEIKAILGYTPDNAQ